MKHILIAALVVLVSLASPAAQGDDKERTIFDLFQGEWRSDGPAFGAPARSTMLWAPALDGKYYRLDYRIEMRSSDGAVSTFEGVAYYRNAGGGSYSAFWADNSGDFHPISSSREGDALIAHWGVDGGKQGKTRYQLSAVGRIEVTDWIKTAEGWRQFNHNIFERAAAD